MRTTWNVVPICADQMRDVNPEDLIQGGHFRLCHTYKGGGGYDQFPYLACKRGLVPHPDQASKQFVVQLHGCNLDCPYCYVTREGVWGTPVRYTTRELVAAWESARDSHGCNVFHLMGGAPARRMPQWPDLLYDLAWGWRKPDDSPMIFHSDLMLTEGTYQPEVLDSLDRPGVLLAVNIKGVDQASWEANTRKPYPADLIHRNLAAVSDRLSAERWYLTFTNVPGGLQRQFLLDQGLEWQDSFSIDLIDYAATPYVDSRPWGGKHVPHT